MERVEMNKYYRLCIALQIMVLPLVAVFSEPARLSSGVTFDGAWSYTIDYSKEEISINGGSIINKNANSTDKLRYALIFMNSPYDNNKEAEGWPLCEKDLEPLKGNSHYENIHDTLVFKDQPPDGTYYTVLVLLESYDGIYGIVDCLTFDRKFSFVNQNGVKVSQLVNQYNQAKSNYEFFENMASTSTDLNFITNASTQALNYVSEMSNAGMQLANYGYNITLPNSTYIIAPFTNYYSYGFVPSCNNQPVTAAPAYVPPAAVMTPPPGYTTPKKRDEARIEYLKQKLADERLQLETYQRTYNDDIERYGSDNAEYDSNMIIQQRQMVNELEKELDEAMRD